jgi:hypothetical protein
MRENLRKKVQELKEKNEMKRIGKKEEKERM